MIKRRNRLSEEDLRKQLLQAPVVALDKVPRTSVRLLGTAKRLEGLRLAYAGPAMLRNQRPDLASLPLRMGADCRLGKEPAENLHVLSRKLRTHLAASIPRDGIDTRPDPELLRQKLLGDKDQARRDWLQSGAVPVFCQMLQAENKPVRLVLVEVLSHIQGDRASTALARLAMVDLSAEVRTAAVRALKDRPAEEYRDLLIAGLRYPWPALADHAAEALAALQDQEAIPLLVELLDAPDPRAPYSVIERGNPVPVVSEVVRINHLRNCLLCHSPSFAATDLGRGAVPVPGKPLPAPATTPQYYEQGELFVKAEVTYLQQDFSVMQTESHPGLWPGHQRYDYLVRTRRVSGAELYQWRQKHKEPADYEQRQAVLFALREITGKDMGTSARTWAKLVSGEGRPRRLAELATSPVVGEWKRFLAPRPGQTVKKKETEASRLAAQLVKAPAARQEALLNQLAEGEGQAFTEALAEAIPELTGKIQDTARRLLVERFLFLGAESLRDKMKDDDSEVRAAAVQACILQEDKAFVPDLIVQLEGADLKLVQTARQGLQKLTGKDFGPAAGVNIARRMQAVEAWRTWLAKQAQE
jgi:HEAT repeat protein